VSNCFIEFQVIVYLEIDVFISIDMFIPRISVDTNVHYIVLLSLNN